MSSRKWRRNPNVVARRIGDDTILVPTGRDIVDRRCLFTLNDTGSFIWELLADARTADQIHAALLEEFDVAGDQAREDLDLFLGRLEDAGCIAEPRPSAASAAQEEPQDEKSGDDEPGA